MKKIVAAALSLAAAFGLAGCESPQDAARKPDVIESFVKQAKAVCPNAAGDATYGPRIKERLEFSSTKQLDALRDKGISICLDKRLSELAVSWKDATYAGVYDADGKVLSLYDTGKTREESKWYENNLGNPNNTIYSLIYQFDKGKVPQTGLYYAGFGAKSSIYWQTPVKADQDTLAKNPWLKEPQVRR